MRLLPTLTLFALLSLPAGLALADEPDVIREPDKVRFKTKTVIDFGAIKLSGEVVKPEMSLVNSRRKTAFISLIRLRGHFRPELERSLDAL